MSGTSDHAFDPAKGPILKTMPLDTAASIPFADRLPLAATTNFTRWVQLGRLGVNCLRATQGWNGKRALCEYFLRNAAHCVGLPISPGGDLFVTMNGTQFGLRPLQGEFHLYREIFLDQVYERLPEFVPQAGWCVVDVGANIGLFTLKVALANRTGRIYALEPHPGTYQRLQRNLELNGIRNVIGLCQGAGKSAGKALLDPGAIPAHAHLAGDGTMANDRAFSVDIVPLAELVEREELVRVNLLKMDVEGAEVQVLEGAETVLDRVERIVMEYHGQERLAGCEAILRRHGFSKVLQLPPSYAYFRKSGDGA
jgi:FkbM family methyltransferase